MTSTSTSTSLAYVVEIFSEKLTSSMEVNTVPATMTVPLATITSVLGKASSFQQAEMSKIATITNDIVVQSLQKRMLLAQATINYYSILNDIATATTTQAAELTKAAQASAVMKTMFADLAYYHGHFPSFGGNLALLVVFSVILALQIVMGVFYHQWWFLTTWTCGLIMEIAGYAGRIWCHFNLFSFSAYVMQMVCVTLAPCFLLAGMYYQLAQLSHIYGEQYSTMKPMAYSYTFIICDIFSIGLQGAGGGLSSGAGSTYQTGINIMLAGLAFQVFTMTVFQFLWYKFLWTIIKVHKQHGDSKFNPDFVHVRRGGWNRQLLHFAAFSLSFLLIYVRSIYRVVEMSEGWDSKLVIDEIYFMILEALMMSLACAIMTVSHPGLLYGRNAHIYIKKTGGGFLSSKQSEQSYIDNHEEEYEKRDSLVTYN